MVSKLPNSSKIIFDKIKEIISLGTIDIPEQFQGSGAPGNTLEYLLNVDENNFDSPDFMDWEIKFHGGNALLTLLHKDPQPKGIIDKMVDAFGWENDKGQLSFRHTISKESKQGFIVNDIDNKITVSNEANEDVVPYWDHNIILNTIAAKLRRLILVSGKVNKEKRQVVYKSAVAYWDLNMLGICNAIKDGIIYIDFDARTKKGKGTSLRRNHGTKFRIKIKDVGIIYENTQIII